MGIIMMAVAALALAIGNAQAKWGYVTFHTIPEGAMILVNTATSYDGRPFDFASGVPTLHYLADGYTPLTVRVPLTKEGLINETLLCWYTPTGPNQFSQRGRVGWPQVPGDYTVSMYNTGPGSNL
jgi:hypothetical protein